MATKMFVRWVRNKLEVHTTRGSPDKLKVYKEYGRGSKLHFLPQIVVQEIVRFNPVELGVDDFIITGGEPFWEKLTRLEVLFAAYPEWTQHLNKMPAAVSRIREMHVKMMPPEPSPYERNSDRSAHPPRGLANASALQVLEIHARRLLMIPRAHGLLQLQAYGCRLGHFPGAVLAMHSLTHLGLAQCSIDKIPDGITQLTGLCDLDLSGNPLHDVDFVCSLPALEVLNISFTYVSALPVGMGALKKLRVLLACRNVLITAIPESVGELHQLENLDISCTKVSRLPSALSACLELRELGLNGTPIRALPAWVGRLPKLSTLYSDEWYNRPSADDDFEEPDVQFDLSENGSDDNEDPDGDPRPPGFSFVGIELDEDLTIGPADIDEALGEGQSALLRTDPFDLLNKFLTRCSERKRARRE